MTSTDSRAVGANREIHFAISDCTLGSVLVASSERGVCAIFMGDDPGALVRDLRNHFAGEQPVGGDAAFEALVASVVRFVDMPAMGLDVPLDLRGSAFQQRVWRALRDIPVGSTATYNDIAKRIGSATSARAVAQACAANPIAVAIPCHRVVRSDGGLSGYRWGVARKRALLEREGAA
jgi:AraC family transcriptional regulator, regulatory protein of adaptative response / methylated-DNA-[protein]-cysteine methyltransferase